MKSKAFQIFATTLLCLTIGHITWADSPRLCSVRGRVVTANGGQPLKHARAQLTSSENPRGFYNVTTDADGQFVFSQVVPGTYRLSVTLNRYVVGIYGQQGDAFSGGGLLTLKPGDDIRDLLFRLVPAAAISGRVLDEEGEPLRGVEVQALIKASRVLSNAEGPPLSQDLMPIQMAVTNDLGQFRLHSLPSGEYYVSAVDSGMQLSDRNLSGGWSYEMANAPQPEYPPTYYPGVTNPSQASRVAVRPGDESTIEFLLRRIDMYTVSGRVLDASGRPAVGAHVSISPEDLATEFLNMRYAGETDSSGRFQIKGVAAGNYSLTASKSDENKQWMAERSTMVSADMSGLELVLLPPVAVSGRIAFDAPASLPSQRTVVWIRSLDQGFRRIGAGKVKKDNSFTVEGLLPGNYMIGVTGLKPDAYLKSAHLGPVDVLKDGLTIGSAAPAAMLDVLVSPYGATLEGTITKGQKPVSGADIRIEMTNPDQGRAHAMRELQTDQYGHFAVHALPPAEYIVTAGEGDNPTVTQVIRLVEQQHANVALTLGVPQ